MSNPLFDPRLIPLKRERAARMGPDYFLHERAFGDILQRVELTNRRFGKAVLLGYSGDDWASRLQRIGVASVESADLLDGGAISQGTDLCISVGLLDTAEPLPAVLAAVGFALAPGALFIGAFAGADSLPALRSAMRATDDAQGSAAGAHIHPRIDAPSFAALLSAAGFVDAVVDIDRVRLRYAGLDALVRDLRAMAATNRLIERPRSPVLRKGLERARDAFGRGSGERTTETIEIVHFAAWLPDSARPGYSSRMSR